jgi:hypothetical protein
MLEIKELGFLTDHGSFVVSDGPLQVATFIKRADAELFVRANQATSSKSRLGIRLLSATQRISSCTSPTQQTRRSASMHSSLAETRTCLLM